MKLKKVSSVRKAKRSAGFSIVEATVGMGVLGTIVVALFSGFTTGFFTMQMSRENLRATQIMLEKMETIRLYSWDQINTPGFIPEKFTSKYDPNAPLDEQGITYTGSMKITESGINSSYSNDMRLVTVKVNWKTGHLNRHRSFTSYISRDGLQNYVY